ncbi:MAG: Asp-tRNA(Asn)/Glu-tRNA(Gln) amidotransferase subunit GatC [Helicobacteraceae bacterium]|nr:Asp-tRNA(Asn)/Glu-tRNA(Gln) amidotransferase subunit GatC [Helicobacteraceae bacterium]
MRIDDKLLNHLETLSMLKIAHEKREEMKRDLTEILGFVEKLNELDTDHHIDAISSLSDEPVRLREDTVREDTRIITEILGRAPKRSEDCFIVPRVVN